MAVQRKKDGSISISNKNGSVSIGKFEVTFDKKHNERYSEWVEECAKLVTACQHTLQETEKYFLEKCDALPLDINDMRMRGFKLNLIMNHCKDKLVKSAQEFSFDMTDEQMEKWYKEETVMRQEAMNTPADKLGLIMRGYYLPRTERNEVFYKEAYEEMKEHMRSTNQDSKEIEMQEIRFFFEESTGSFQASGGGRKLIQQLVAFRGISEDDINKRTTRFLGYISALRELGVLDNFERRQ